MSDIIQLLPDSVANQIAAGEVIQRPANVVKELVENAIDAEATRIDVYIEDAGRTSIQVVDNGKGMSETDARLSFERHATSKIRTAADLFALTTMGFRGEALPSIAAVATVELKTRRAEDELGTHILITASKLESQEPCYCQVGCNFRVENLFFNVPARRKFLKSNAVEMSNIVTSFERIALVTPNITFSLYNNGNTTFNLHAGTPLQRILDVFGEKMENNLLPVNVDTSLCRISGYVGKPESARHRGAQQFFFVNGRFMRHPYFSKALMSVYDRMIPAGDQVPYFVYIDVPPATIDVNIHPLKTEVKFENEQAVCQILVAAVRNAVGMFSGVTAIDFNADNRPDIPTFTPSDDAKMPDMRSNPSYNPFNEPHPASSVEGWQQLYDGIGRGGTPANASLFAPSPADNEHNRLHTFAADKSQIHYQYKGKYIMTAVKSGLMIIDQHRAHVCVLFEKYMQQLAEQTTYSQRVLFPETMRLSARDDITLQKILSDVEALGFDISSLGGCTYAVNAVPSGLDGLNASALVKDMIAAAADGLRGAADERRRSLAAALARTAAISYGQVLDNDEMESLTNDLFACSNFNYTPDGKKVVALLRQSDLEHLLGG